MLVLFTYVQLDWLSEAGGDKSASLARCPEGKQAQKLVLFKVPVLVVLFIILNYAVRLRDLLLFHAHVKYV